MPTSNGDLATSVGEPTEKSEAGKKFLADYEAAKFAEPAAAYGGYSYDAAKAIIEGLKVALKDASDVKGQRQAIDRRGRQGRLRRCDRQVGFDEFGDTKVKVISGYKVDGGKWAFVKSENLG